MNVSTIEQNPNEKREISRESPTPLSPHNPHKKQYKSQGNKKYERESNRHERQNKIIDFAYNGTLGDRRK